MSDRGWEDTRIPREYRQRLVREHNERMVALAAGAREEAAMHDGRGHLPKAAQSREDARVFDSLAVDEGLI